LRKVTDELGGNAAQLRDVLRATVAYETVRETRVGAATLMDQFGKNIVRVKDRIATPLASGYRDLLMNVRLKSGLISEIQFVSRDVLDTKMHAGHRIYEELRRPGLDREMAAELSSRVAILYDDAYRRDGNGSWGK
jgi:hypothetical protein